MKRFRETKELIDTVMRTTATKREARKYIAKYGINGTGIGPKRRISIIKLRYDDESVLPKVGRAITQLMTLGANPVVYLDSSPEIAQFSANSLNFGEARAALFERMQRLNDILDTSGKSNPFWCPFNLNSDASTVAPFISQVLASGRIPLLAGLSYDEITSYCSFVQGNDGLKELVRELDKNEAVEVDKIVFIDPLGGIPSPHRKAAHVFINLKQEYGDISAELLNSDLPSDIKQQRIEDLSTLNELLPTSKPMRTGIMTTPQEAGSLGERNPIIYNLLADRPLISPSLPINLQRTQLVTSMVRPGFPVKIIRDDKGFDLRQKARAGEINLSRLEELINRSFGRELDIEHYLARIKSNFASVILVGDYDGAAIITWERSKTGTPIAYLDKFAVDPQSQGTAGVADILLIQMVRKLYPKEVIWRSRGNNPVNKWYFERSTGFMKVPDSQWVMFWNSKDVSPPLDEYLAICSNIEPSFKK